MSEHAHGHTEGHETHHYNYVKIWGILLVLLIISVVGPFLEIPAVTLITAFGIAFVKAYLVIKYFMHLTVQPKVVVYMLTVCLGFMLVFFAGVAPDVMEHEGANWENVAAKNVPMQYTAPGHGGHGEHAAPAHGGAHGGAAH